MLKNELYLCLASIKISTIRLENSSELKRASFCLSLIENYIYYLKFLRNIYLLDFLFVKNNF